MDAPKYRVNHLIKTEAVMLIDETGTILGPTPIAKALALSLERGYDLVEVAPKGNPPVAKMLNYGQFQYEQEKQARKQKAHQKKTELKGIRLSLQIGEHDVEFRVKQAEDFLTEGNKVKVELMLRGREMQHTDLARKQIDAFAKRLTTPFIIEQPITKQGNKISMIIMADNKQ
jgi:translation initiation factor IF-3